MQTIDRVIWMCVGALLASAAYVASDALHAESAQEKFVAAQCYVYDDESQTWNRLRHGRP